MKKLLVWPVILIAGLMTIGSGNLVFAQQNSIKLFDATSTFATGPRTSPAEAIPFVPSRSLMIDFAAGDTAMISSTPDGNGPFVVDNFLTINGVNVCEGEGCFGPIINPTEPTGVPIDAVLTPIPPIDVTSFIPVGKNLVQFDLKDFGEIAGNTDLFLVTTASVNSMQAPTAANAIDVSMDLFNGQLRPAMVQAFHRAFEKQVRTPVLTGLWEANADPETFAKVDQQLSQASAEEASTAATALVSLLDGQTLVPKMQRNLSSQFSEPAVAPTLEKFTAAVGSPSIKIHQSISDILAFGFDAEKVAWTWNDISAKADLVQDVLPKPVAAQVTGTGSCFANSHQVGCTAGTQITGVNGLLDGTLECSLDSSGKIVCVVRVPDLSREGIIALLIAVLGLAAHGMGIARLPRGLNLRFAVIITIFGGVVFLFYRDEVLGSVLAPLAVWTARITLALLHGLGIDAVRDGAVLAHPNGFAYEVAYSCTGFLPIIFFIACVLAYPAKWHDKRVGITLGVPLLWVVNLLRLVDLFYIGVYVPEAFALAHEVVWTGLLVVTFIALWLSWIRWSGKSIRYPVWAVLRSRGRSHSRIILTNMGHS